MKTNLKCCECFNLINVVVEDDLSQSVRNGYLLLEDEIDHVRAFIKEKI